MNSKSFFLLSAVSIFPLIGVFCSCSSDDTDDVNDTKALSESSISKTLVNSSSVRVINSGATSTSVVKGYDTIKKVANLGKIAVGNEMARQMNIVPGVYLARTVLIEKTLSAAPNSYILYPNASSTISSKTGMVDSNVMSSSRMFGWTTPTPRLDASTSTFVGKTYLIYIYANMAGQRVAYYYPYAPERLEWSFQTINL